MRIKSIWGLNAKPGSLGVPVTVVAEGDRERRTWVLHPFLIGLFPILSVYFHNVYDLPLRVLIAPIGLVLVTTTAIWMALRAWTRDSLRAGLATSLVMALFFGYEGIRSGVDQAWYSLNAIWVMRETRVPPLLILALVGLVAALGCRAIFRRIARPTLWTSYLNAFTLILVSLPTAGLISSRIGLQPATPRDVGSPVLGDQVWKPDIYFIILDGFARSDVLKERYDFDNRPFINRLEQRGFVVARESESNYCQTQFSIASTLNADYLDKLLDPRSKDLLPVAELIKKNLVSRLLRPMGYRYVTFATGYDPTDTPGSDIYLTSGSNPSLFNLLLIRMTPLASIFAESPWVDSYSQSRRQTLYTLETLPSIASIPGPTFTFAHIVSPHPPFIFGSNGEDVSPRVLGPDSKPVRELEAAHGSPDYVRRAYRDQASYIMNRIDRTIDQILENSTEPPVIVLQSDHGSWLHYHPFDAAETDVHERFGTLNAILIPGRKPEGFTDHAISVNTFRIVLNTIFGAKMPLLKESNYFSTINDPLIFIDVTERLHSEQERTRNFRPPDRYLGLTRRDRSRILW